jgi:tetratricopeptide (TPR) repeat protein
MNDDTTTSTGAGMGLETPTPDTQHPTPNIDGAEARARRYIGVLIAAVAVLAALLAYLNAEAGAQSSVANREARRLTIEATGLRSTGTAKVGSDLHAARSWLELGKLGASAERAGDLQTARTYYAAREEIAKLSPLLSEEYSADIRRYEDDVYLRSTVELTERAAAASLVDSAWGSKAGGYIIILTVLAIALALYGLSAASVPSRARQVLVAAGSALVAVAIVWALAVYLQPVPTIPVGAIEAYARGVGLSYQGKPDQAIAALDEALGASPTYANALVERGRAHSARKDYEAAVADYLAARAAGSDDTSLNWNLGWTYYLLGRFDDAAAVDRHTLDLDAGLVPVRLNLALSLLAAGKAQEAEAEYARAMDVAAGQVAEANSAGRVVPYSFWSYLDTGARDLEGVLDRLAGTTRSWTQAPPREAIADPAAIETPGRELLARLKSVSVALEYDLKPLQSQASLRSEARVSPFRFAGPEGEASGGGPRTPFESGTPLDLSRKVFFPPGGDTSDLAYQSDAQFPEEQFKESFSIDTPFVATVFTYEGILEGEDVTWKTYVNGYEDYSLRRTQKWSLAESGQAIKIVTFVFGEPGEYTLEMYAGSQLAQRGGFTLSSK